MGLFQKFKAGLQKTHSKLAHEIKRIVSRSPKLDAATLDDLETALIAADLGMAVTSQIVGAVKRIYETQGGAGLDVFAIARQEVQQSLASNTAALKQAPGGLTVVSIVGVNGTGKTTTAAKLAWLIQSQKKTALLAACDTFRAAAIEQLEIWASRSGVEMIKTRRGGDPAAVLYDAATAAKARHINELIVDTAGRLHTKTGLMDELDKMRRTAAKLVPGAPHEVLLVMDATTGQNGLQQARQFTQSAGVTGIVLTKLDGTAKGGIAVAIARELNLPVRFAGVGEQMTDLLEFSPAEFVDSLLE